MRTRTAAGLLLALLFTGLVAAACGSGDGGQASIRTDKGLAVAAVGANFDPRRQGSSNSGPATNAQSSAGGAVAPAPALSQSGLSYGGDVKAFPAAPVLQEGGKGLTVQGYGTATADADSAIAEFYFSINNPGIKPLPYPGQSEPGAPGSTQGGGVAPPVSPVFQGGEVKAITEADLQPVIDAIAGAGVGRDDIQFLNAYSDPYSSSATLRVTVKNVNNVDAVVQAAQKAASGLAGIALSSSNASYTVGDCSPLEKAAMKSAVDDAGSRAASFAGALGVNIGGVIAASNYSYSPFGGSPCGGGFIGPVPLASTPYSRNLSRSVQVFANISVTYAIQ